jgi:hypothetical protein
MAARDRAHRSAQSKLDDLTGAKLAALLEALPDPSTQSSFDAYNLAAARLVGGAQRRSAQLALAYVVVGRPQQRTPQLARAIAPVLVSRESPVTRSPMLRLRHELSQGATTPLAVAAAAGVAARLASNDLQVAERSGLDEGAQSTGQRIVGWRKEPSGDACAWCLEVAETVYGSADGVPFHEHDQCGVTPVFEGE